MRKITIDDRKLLEILNEKEKLQESVDKRIEKFKNLTAKTDELKAKIEELQKEFKAEYAKVEDKVKQIDEEMKPYLLKMQRYKDKINPILTKKDIKTNEFEIITSTQLERGKVVVVIEDMVENYKEQLRKQKNEQTANTTNPKQEKK